MSGHAGNEPEARAETIATAQVHLNIYLETCSIFRAPGVIQQLVDEAGADRVLFSSDMPLVASRFHIG